MSKQRTPFSSIKAKRESKKGKIGKLQWVQKWESSVASLSVECLSISSVIQWSLKSPLTTHVTYCGFVRTTIYDRRIFQRRNIPALLTTKVSKIPFTWSLRNQIITYTDSYSSKLSHSWSWRDKSVLKSSLVKVRGQWMTKKIKTAMVEIARDCSLLEILIEKFIIFWNNENDRLWHFFFPTLSSKF